VTQDLKISFENAYVKWRSYCEQAGVAEYSSDQPYIDNPPFRDIVALGPTVVPLIIGKMKSDPAAHFLIHALEQITGRRFSPQEIEIAKQKYGSPLGNQGYVRMWIDWWEREGRPDR
jgi:hypothetical protein